MREGDRVFVSGSGQIEWPYQKLFSKGTVKDLNPPPLAIKYLVQMYGNGSYVGVAMDEDLGRYPGVSQTIYYCEAFRIVSAFDICLMDAQLKQVQIQLSQAVQDPNATITWGMP